MMSEVHLRQEDLDAYVRERVEMVLIGSPTKTDKSLHLPASRDCTESVCRFRSQRDGWRVKAIAVYPPGHVSYCAECVERTFGVEVVDR